jgi:hypothetical protein
MQVVKEFIVTLNRSRKPLSLIKKSLIICLSAILIAVSVWGGFAIFGKQLNISVTNNYLSISIDDITGVYASAIQYAWVNAIPVQTDDTHYEWINGRPYIFTNVPSSATYDITNDPATKNFGIITASSSNYAKGSAPNNPVVDGDCTFTLTVTGSATTDIDVHGHNFTGGVGWTLAGAVGVDTVKITLYKTGDNPASGLVLTSADQEFASLATGAHTHWDFNLETGTFTDGVQKTGVITFTGRVP